MGSAGLPATGGVITRVHDKSQVPDCDVPVTYDIGIQSPVTHGYVRGACRRVLESLRADPHIIVRGEIIILSRPKLRLCGKRKDLLESYQPFGTGKTNAPPIANSVRDKWNKVGLENLFVSLAVVQEDQKLGILYGNRLRLCRAEACGQD